MPSFTRTLFCILRGDDRVGRLFGAERKKPVQTHRHRADHAPRPFATKYLRNIPGWPTTWRRRSNAPNTRLSANEQPPDHCAGLVPERVGRQRALLGADPWEYGLTPANQGPEMLIGYSKAGGLITDSTAWTVTAWTMLTAATGQAGPRKSVPGRAPPCRSGRPPQQTALFGGNRYAHA